MKFPTRRMLKSKTLILMFALGTVNCSQADEILHTPPGLVPGDHFRFVFCTLGGVLGQTTASSSSIADYNAFVIAAAAAEAGGQVIYEGTPLQFSAIASTSTVSAIANIGETGASVWDPELHEIAVSDTSTGLWKGFLLHPIDINLTGDSTGGRPVWTGTNQFGTTTGVSPLGSAKPTNGASGSLAAGWVSFSTLHPASSPFSMYAISQELTVGPAAVPEPSALVLLATGAISCFGYVRFRRRPHRFPPPGARDQRGARPPKCF